MDDQLNGTHPERDMIIGYRDEGMNEEVLLRRLREEAGTPEQVVDCLIHFGLLERI